MMRGRRPDIRSLPRSMCWSRMGRGINNMLDLPDDEEGRVRSPLSWRLSEWRALGDLWRLEDPRWWSLWPRSSLCEWWRSDPPVPDGWSDNEDRSTSDTLDEWVLLDFLSWDLESRSSVALDEVAVLSFLAESCCCQVDPSSLFLMGGACSPLLGHATQWIHPSSCVLVSWLLPPSSSVSELCPTQPMPQVTNLYRHHMALRWYTV